MKRTINDFEPILPPGWESCLEAAISAAIHAPNHRRTEPWRFYLLGEESKGRVCALNAELVASNRGEEAGRDKFRRWMAVPGWLVVTCVRGRDFDDGGIGGGWDMGDPMGMAREDYAACCCAVQNLWLSLHSRGIGTKWTTGAVNFDDRFADAVGFRMKEEFTVGTIWFGTPVHTPSPPAKRMGLENVLTKVN
ncbi:hypothetical protein ACHAXA_011117 [Cyclostephanos tholiformis]|uniref:Nitroreductase domain-containing protein n=1 Tax=Cyclostephanos tholiformis TaxID=382380 RepID=A0ABD3SF06_9STRA